MAFATAQAAEETGAEAAPDSDTLMVELNRLDPDENTCKASLVISNQTETGFESLALDLVIFDNDGIIAGRMAVELAPLPSSKTSVRAFSLGGMDCDSVGRVLLNSVVSCKTGEGEQPDCLGMIRTASRTDVPFIE
ncbi:MAG TPA: hypothetical protein VK090_07855 [Paracoccaceae bacterium]|nr:hypothetical protein [Paracoccaceae bacterium]